MGILVGLALTVLVAVLVYGCWNAESAGTFDPGRDSGESLTMQDGQPTPTAPGTWDSDKEEATDQVWNDQWVSFSTKPHVCNGVLEFAGQARNGARVSYDANDTLPFVLYRKSDLSPSFFGSSEPIDPIAGFLAPLTGGQYYTSLGPTDIVADTLVTASNGEFRVVADWPGRFSAPGDVALGVWGYRPNYGEDNIRLITVEACRADQ